MKDTMLEFMTKQALCVIATSSDNLQPEAAYVGYSHNEKLELFIGTSKLSRKYSNLIKNPKVAVVIADTTAEVQYEGIAAVIADNDYKKLVEDQHIVKLPGSIKYREDPNQVYIKIKPTWIRFLLHGEPDRIEEFREFSDEG